MRGSPPRPGLLLFRLLSLAAVAAVLWIEAYILLKQERILQLLPWLAHHASVAELARNGEQYAGRWIRTEGLIGSIKEPTAILRPSVPAEAEASILLHNLPVLGIWTASLASLTDSQIVEVAGEWETGPGAFEMLHLDIAGITRPLQARYWLSVLAIVALVPAVAALTWIAFRRGRSSKDAGLPKSAD